VLVGGRLVRPFDFLCTLSIANILKLTSSSPLSDIIAFFIVSAVFLLAFAGWEHILFHSPRFSLPPLLPLEIFRRGRVLLVMFVGLTTWAAFQPLLLYIVRE
jgi:hypothetical protein